MLSKSSELSRLSEVDRASDELRDGIASSREIVRQTRLLIELSESETLVPAGPDVELQDSAA